MSPYVDTEDGCVDLGEPTVPLPILTLPERCEDVPPEIQVAVDIHWTELLA